jgi:GTP-binding protein
MYEFLKYYEIPVILVATKADKMPRSKWAKHEKIVKRVLSFDQKDTFVVFSAETKFGKNEAWSAIEEKL